MIVLPVNPVSVGWAAAYYRLMLETASSKASLAGLLPTLQSFFQQRVASASGKEKDLLPKLERCADTPPVDADPLVIIQYLAECRDQLIRLRVNQPALRELLDATERVMPYVGLDKELEAVSPEPSFGILSRSIEKIGATVPDWQVNQDAVQELARQVDVSSKSGQQGLPCMKAGQFGSVPVYLVASGQPDDLNGESIYPFGRSREHKRNAVAIALGMMFHLWDAQKEKWKPGMSLKFGLPMPSAKLKAGSDVEAFVKFVTPQRNQYGAKEKGPVILMEFGPNDVLVNGVVISGSERMPFRASKVESETSLSYSGSMGRDKIKITFDGTSVVFDSPNLNLRLPLVKAEYVSQGLNDMIAPPAVNVWLHNGLMGILGDLRVTDSRTAQILVNLISAQLGRKATVDDVRNQVAVAANSLTQLPITLTGKLVAPDNSPAILPQVDYYGAPALIRSLAGQRAAKRRSMTDLPSRERVQHQISEKEKIIVSREVYPPSFAYIEYEAGKEADRVQSAKKFQSGFDAGEFGSIEDARELRKLENMMWKTGERASQSKQTRAIPLIGEDSPIQSIFVTVWGYTGDMQYQPVWQSGAVSAADVEDIVMAGRKPPVESLYEWVIESSGIASLGPTFGEMGPPVSYAIVISSVVSIPRAQGLKLPLPKPFPLGTAKVRGRTDKVGMYVSALRVTRVKTFTEKGSEVTTNIPSREMDPKDNLPDAIVIGNVGLDAVLPLTYQLGRVIWDRSNRQLAPAEGKAALFTLPVVQQTKEFARLYDLARAEAETAEVPMTEEQVKAATWDSLMEEGVLPFYGRGGIPNVVFGGRRAYAVLGGSKGQVKRIGQTQMAGGGYTSGRLVSSDPTNAQWATKKPQMYRDIIGFAHSIIRQVSLEGMGARRTQQPSEQDVRQLMGQYGIIVDNFDNPAEYLQALEKLKSVYTVRPMSYKMEVGQLPYDPNGSEYGKDLINQMAQLNPRHRRAQRPRWRSRRNPLSEYQIERATRYLESKKKEREPGDLPEIFRAARGKPGVGEFTPERVRLMFPREAIEGKDTWVPKNRIPASLGKFDAVVRVGSKDRPEELVRQGRLKATEQEMPLDDADVLALMMEEAGLSLEAIGDILAAQRSSTKVVKSTKGKTRFSMQPSTAICKAHKGRRLTGYQPPDQVMRAGNPRNYKVLILMSPLNAGTPRVMTWRRGAHLDCDLVGTTPEDLPELLGRAIQSSMLWLVEREGHHERSKRNRMNLTDILVGRVGQPFLYVAYRAGEQVSLDRISKNLQLAADPRETDLRISLYGSESERKRMVERDIENYMEALEDTPSRQPKREDVSIQEKTTSKPEVGQTERLPTARASTPVRAPLPSLMVPPVAEPEEEGDNDEDTEEVEKMTLGITDED